MKRIVFSVILIMLLCCSMIIPALGAELQGGYYLTGDSAMGSGLTFYVPADYAEGSLTYDSSGNLFNLTSSSIYLYCPDYPGYTIYAPRFSGFQYRASSGTGYQYEDLMLHNISATNVQIFTSDPGYQLPDYQLFLILVGLVLAFGLAFIIVPRR